ncbi:MAG: hypothetical protein EWM72_02018 [Nitrospira sp.]|nr:MAG: hypothetical protein EWM72_02018 [Nitrospira sp.]
MQHPHRPWLRPNLIQCLLTTGCLSLIMAGCAGTPSPVTTIHQDSRSAVFLQNVSDRSYRAAHPIKLEETTVASVLRGVHTEENADFTLFVSKALKSYVPSDTRAFSEDDIAVLTPYLTSALAQAAPNQRVGFRLHYALVIPTQSQKASQNMDTTAGHLFADGLSLHLTLTQHRPGKVDASKKDKEPKTLPDPTGLRDRQVKFIPETAVRPETSDWFEPSDDRTLVIDYQLLAKLLATPPAVQPVPPTPAPVAQPVQPAPSMPAPVGKSDPDLQAFKEELKALQKKLDEQNAELQKLKKSSTKKKPAP